MLVTAGIATAAVTAFGSHYAMSRKATESRESGTKLSVNTKAMSRNTSQEELNFLLSEKNPFRKAAPPTDLKNMAAEMQSAMKLPERTDDGVRIYYVVKQWWDDNAPHDEKGAYYLDVDGDRIQHCYKLFDSSVFGPYISKGSTAAEGQFYAIYQTSPSSPWWDYYVRYDVDTWQWNDFWNENIQISCTAMAYDPWTDQMFGYSYDDYGKSTYKLAVLDWEKKSRRAVGPIVEYNDRIVALAAGRECLYGFDKDWNFYKISKTDGQKTFVGRAIADGETKNTTIQMCSAVVDIRTDRLFFAGTYRDLAEGKDYSAIWEIDPDTGASTEILNHRFNQQDVGFWSEELSNGNCPELATDLIVDVPAGEMEGTFSFTAPVTLRNGEETSGELKYEVVINGKSLAEGNTTCGSTVTLPLTVDNADSYKISVKTENSAGPSRWAREEQVIGYAKPAAPIVDISFDENGTPTVTWQQVSTSSAGVPIDPASITYDVIRYPQGTPVATGITELSFSDNADLAQTFGIYYYGVISRYLGITSSDESLTKGFFRGSAEPAYEFFGFTESNSHAFEVINGDGDEYKWELDNGLDKERDYMSLWESYSSGAEINDDWLIAPPAHLMAGKYYRVEFCMNPMFNHDVKYEIRLGKSAAKEDLELMACSGIAKDNDQWTWYGDYVKITEEGNYRPALGITGEKGTSGVGCKGYRISDAKDPGAPGRPTDFSGRSSRDDARLIEMSFKAPAVDFDGNPLSKIDRLTISRDGEEIAAYSNVRPGQTITCTNTVYETGKEYKFKIVASNEFGEGWDLYADVYAGIRKSAPVTDVYAWQSAPDKITMTWKAPELDEIGNPISPENITYNISLIDGYIINNIAQGLTDTTYTFDYTPENPEEQEFISFQISTTTEGGESKGTSVIPVAVGNPIGYPYGESFTNGQLGYSLGVFNVSGSPQWGTYTDTNFSDLESQDFDNGMIGMYSTTRGDASMLMLPKVSLKDAADPVLSFYTYNISGDAGPDDNEIEILVNDGSGFMPLASTTVAKLGNPGWNRVKVSLAQYKGKEIQIAVKGTVMTYTFVLLDNIRISDKVGHNIAVAKAACGEEAIAGEDMKVSVRIENTGDNDAEGIRLLLVRDNESVAELDIDRLESGIGKNCELVYKSSPLDSKRMYFKAVVQYDKDEIDTDNESEVFRVRFREPSHPTVSELTATLENGTDVLLSWDEPILSETPAIYRTENFDSAEPWNKNEASGWTLIDRDGLPAGGMKDLELPGMKDQDGTPLAVGFFVVDSSSDIFGASAASWASYAGSRHLCSIYAQGGANDDWAISPRLSGKKQTVSFYARSYSADYKETLRIMASDKSADPSDFTQVAIYNEMSAEWTRYEVELPAGTQYFAFNCVSNDCFMLFIDCVTFSSDDLAYELTGYNVYRDASRLNGSIITGKTFTDSAVSDGMHSYVVTAVYNVGESGPSPEANVEVSGITGTEMDSMRVFTAENSIYILNMAGQEVKVSDTAGRLYYSGVPAGDLKVPCPSGIYLVTSGSRTVKVVVK